MVLDETLADWAFEIWQFREVVKVRVRNYALQGEEGPEDLFRQVKALVLKKQGNHWN